MSHLSTHVLDSTTGAPAEGMEVVLVDPGGTVIATATTDADGRVSELGPDQLPPGDYTLGLATGPWFAARGIDAFYPSVTVTFRVPETAAAHYHVPLLLSPFAYTTYRGS